MKRILITGANKGIGLAAVQALLEQRDDVSVLLAARDPERGCSAVASLCQHNAGWEQRLDFLELDVSDDRSVAGARDSVADTFGPAAPLYAIVNNAGIGLGSSDMASVIDVNTLGVKRVCDAFLPLVAPGGRIVNVSSASAPRFVSGCDASMRSFFQDASLDWSDIEALIGKVLSAGNDPQRLSSMGLGEGNPYGFSKACTSLYTMILARQHPQLHINACTPGYIETDLTRPTAEARGVAPIDMGMKPPAHGTVAILHLLFGELEGNGHYYGSDAKRSPLDRYRAPGTPAFTGN